MCGCISYELWAQRFDISVIQRINGAKDILCGDSRRLYEAQLNGLVAPRGEDLGDDLAWPREHVWWPSMADVECPEPTALHGPIGPEPTSTSSPPQPEYIDADDTPSPAEGPASGVDGREITEQLGVDRWSSSATHEFAPPSETRNLPHISYTYTIYIGLLCPRLVYFGLWRAGALVGGSFSSSALVP